MIGADTTFLVQLEISELPANASAHALLRREILTPGVPLALAPLVLAEFIHIVTDPRRFQRPLNMPEAISKADYWWNAQEVCQVFPSALSVQLTFAWLRQYQLGRKRILDTQLAAILWSAGVHRIITSNPSDFALLGFEPLSP
jgi:predicted nucleic acid-binding protein